MLCFPNCKINIGLFVTERRADGYHNIETIFYPIPWEDVLEIVPAEKVSLHLHGRTIEGNINANLVYRAYELLKRDFDSKISPVAIHLLKNIPMGAGLGGGSANGAFMLRLLNDHFALGISETRLAAYALQLGSDCPFFIYNAPQYAKGRGEQMQTVTLELTNFSIQVVYPGIHVNTGAAFKMIQPQPASVDLNEISTLPVEQWKDVIKNDFEAPVFEQHPEIALVKVQLYEQGALYASMSGSGSAVYGIFKKGEKALINDAYEVFYVS